MVLATGGGAILADENRQALRRAGGVVWLQADAEALARRLAHDATTGDRRPALTDQGTLAEVGAVLAAREEFYRMTADLCIDTTNVAPEQVADRVLTWFRNNR
jgi:shikimate kinase